MENLNTKYVCDLCYKHKTQSAWYTQVYLLSQAQIADFFCIWYGTQRKFLIFAVFISLYKSSKPPHPKLKSS